MSHPEFLCQNTCSIPPLLFTFQNPLNPVFEKCVWKDIFKVLNGTMRIVSAVSNDKLSHNSMYREYAMWAQESKI
jgi:hypothetical protein